jgi:hypothetical protein
MTATAGGGVVSRRARKNALAAAVPDDFLR